jgi:hypothetical protein
MRWKERNFVMFENGGWETVSNESDEVVGRRKESWDGGRSGGEGKRANTPMRRVFVCHSPPKYSRRIQQRIGAGGKGWGY